VHVVRERTLAVDLDDRQPLAIARLERRLAADIDLLELEVVLGAQLRQRRPRPLAEVALRRVVERDADYG
jgi:hypothetical protein